MIARFGRYIAHTRSIQRGLEQLDNEPAHALIIGPKAQVDAKVFARDITVYGAVSGKVTATEIVDIRDSARVSGELAAPSVKLAEGARVNARVETKRVDAAVHVARYRMARNAR